MPLALLVIDLLRYLIACVLFVSAGAGLLRLLRPRLDPVVSVLLGVCAVQALLAASIGSAVVAGVALKRIAIPLWGVLLGLAVYGVSGQRWWRIASPERRRLAILLAVSAVAAPLVMLPFFVHGLADYPGSGFLDGWSYIVFGQYLWDFPRLTEGGLAPVYQYAVHLSHARFAASGQLGLLSFLSIPGDTESANGLMRALGIFSMAAACAALAEVRRLSLPRGVLYVAVAAISGWVFNVVWANNYDHQLALQYFPALAALGLGLPAWTRRTALLTGLITAGALYTYPEFAILAVGSAGLLALEVVIVRRAFRALAHFVIVGVTAVILAAPYGRDCLAFMQSQLSIVQNGGVRPGAGMFPGLLDPPHRLSALVALGGERLSPHQPWLRMLLAVIVLTAIAAGVLRWLRRRELAFPLIVSGFCTLAGLLVWRQQYDYGAYKILSLGWWVFALAVIDGLTWLPDGWGRAWGRARAPLWALAGALAAAVPLVTSARALSETIYAPDERISQYRVLERLPEAIGHAPVMLDAGTVTGEHWGVYYLRHADVLLGQRGGYLAMPHLVKLLDRAEPIPAAGVRYVVTDASITATQRPAGWRLVWGVGRYGVWDTSSQGWATITRVRDALGNDVQILPAIYAGPPGATLRVLASRAGTLALTTQLFNQFSLSDRSCWRLEVSTAATGAAPAVPDLALRPGLATIQLLVPAGQSSITLRATPARPTVYSITPERAREGSLTNTSTTLLPAGTVPTAPSYPACDAS